MSKFMIDQEGIRNAIEHQLTIGCQSPCCKFNLCKSCPDFMYRSMTLEQIHLLIPQLSSAQYICPNIPPILYSNDLILNNSMRWFEYFEQICNGEKPKDETIINDIFSDPSSFSYIFFDFSDSFTPDHLSISDQLISKTAQLCEEKKLIVPPELFFRFLSVVLKDPYFCSLHHLRTVILLLAFTIIPLPEYFTYGYIQLFQHINLLPKECLDLIVDSLIDTPNFRTQIIKFLQRNLSNIVKNLNDINPHRVVEISEIITNLAFYRAIDERSSTNLDRLIYQNRDLCEIIRPFDEFILYMKKKAESYVESHFILTLPFKNSVRQTESFFTESNYIYLGGSILFTEPEPIKIEIRREFILEDTIKAIQSTPTKELRKRLFVSFTGESGVDAGGVSREFFYLLSSKTFSDHGFFEPVGENNEYLWFAMNDSEQFINLSIYKVLGILIGIAMNNNIILPIRFPMVMYKKLKDRKDLGLMDLQEIQPAISQSLKILLLQNEDEIAKADNVFAVTILSNGKPKDIELIPNGINTPVTKNNVYNYVEALSYFYLYRSIEKQFSAFKEGYCTVINTKFAQSFEPEELDLIISGQHEINWIEFQETALYVEYTRASPTIISFWKVFNEFREEQKKRFLKFAIGTDKVPFDGFKSLKFTIKRTNDLSRFPVAHTCTCLLDMPDYKEYGIMKHRLQTCVENCEGFQLI